MQINIRMKPWLATDTFYLLKKENNSVIGFKHSDLKLFLDRNLSFFPKYYII